MNSKIFSAPVGLKELTSSTVHVSATQHNDFIFLGPKRMTRISGVHKDS